MQHSVRSLLAQHINGPCLGWSEVCDHNMLRNALVLQTAAGPAEALASAPSLGRLETNATSVHAPALHGVSRWSPGSSMRRPAATRPNSLAQSGAWPVAAFRLD